MRSQLGDNQDAIEVVPGQFSTVQVLLKGACLPVVCRRVAVMCMHACARQLSAACRSLLCRCRCRCCWRPAAAAADMFGYEMWFVKWCALIMAAFIVLFAALIIGALRFFNFQRR
jgi:hypothetical protein